MDPSIYTNTCQYCSSPIPDKTKSGKLRKFCDKSCSRKYTCKMKPEVVAAANKKGYQTLLQREDSAEFLAHRGRLTEAKREFLSNNRYDIAKHASQGGKTHRKPEVVKKKRQSMIDKGYWLDYTVFDSKEVKRYTQAVHRLTKKLYGPAGEGYQWDHTVPVSLGFKLNIPIELMCSSENVEKMIAKENTSKGTKLNQKALWILENWSENWA